jgi:hypothetical protein
VAADVRAPEAERIHEAGEIASEGRRTVVVVRLGGFAVAAQADGECADGARQGVGKRPPCVEGIRGAVEKDERVAGGVSGLAVLDIESVAQADGARLRIEGVHCAGSHLGSFRFLFLRRLRGGRMRMRPGCRAG